MTDRKAGKRCQAKLGHRHSVTSPMEFLLQIALIVACLFYGARKGGIALGLLGGIGIVLLVFVFRLLPSPMLGG